MADRQLYILSTHTALDKSDVVAIQDAAGAAELKLISLEELFEVINDFTANTSLLDADKILIYDAGTSSVNVATLAVLDTKKKTVHIPAGYMTAATTNGCAAIATSELTATTPELYSLDFDATSDEFALFGFAFPKSWNEGTITYRVWWTSTAADTDGVAWGLQGVALADGDAINTAFGTAVLVTDDALGTASDIYITAESAALTIAGSPAAGEYCYFRIYRDVSDANDDMAEDAQLVAVDIFYTVNSRDDT